MILGHREVVHVERILCLDVAPDVAIAEVHTRPLLTLMGVGERLRMAWVVRIRQVVPPLGIERDRKIERLEAVGPAFLAGRLLDQTRALGPLIEGHLLHVEHRADPLV